MKCLMHRDCGNECLTEEEQEEGLCLDCFSFMIEQNKQHETNVKNLVELRLAMDLIRRAAGLSEELTPHEIACKVTERLAHLDQVESQWKPFSHAPKDGSDVDLWSRKIGRIADCYYDKDIMRWKCGTNTIKSSHITHFMVIDSPKDGQS